MAENQSDRILSEEQVAEIQRKLLDYIPKSPVQYMVENRYPRQFIAFLNDQTGEVLDKITFPGKLDANYPPPQEYVQEREKWLAEGVDKSIGWHQKLKAQGYDGVTVEIVTYGSIPSDIYKKIEKTTQNQKLAALNIPVNVGEYDGYRELNIYNRHNLGREEPVFKHTYKAADEHVPSPKPVDRDRPSPD